MDLATLTARILSAPYSVVDAAEARVLSSLLAIAAGTWTISTPESRRAAALALVERLEEDARVHDFADNVAKCGVLRTLADDVASFLA